MKLFRRSYNPHTISVNLLLTFSDIFTWGVYGIIISLLGLFLAITLGENAIEFVGIGTGIRFVVRGIVQIPAGIVSDKIKEDIDEVLFLMLGSALMGISCTLLIFVQNSIQYYILEIIFGIGSGLNIVEWRKLFAKNLVAGKEGTSYAAYDVAMSIAIAIFSIVGGIIANIDETYFRLVIIGVGVIIIASNIWVYLVYVGMKYKKNLQITN